MSSYGGANGGGAWRIIQIFVINAYRPLNVIRQLINILRKLEVKLSILLQHPVNTRIDPFWNNFRFYLKKLNGKLKSIIGIKWIFFLLAEFAAKFTFVSCDSKQGVEFWRLGHTVHSNGCQKYILSPQKWSKLKKIAVKNSICVFDFKSQFWKEKLAKTTKMQNIQFQNTKSFV